MLISKCCEECSLNLENESNSQRKLFRCFPSRLSVRCFKFFTCFKRTRDKGNSRKIKRLSELRTHVHLAQTGEEKVQDK